MSEEFTTSTVAFTDEEKVDKSSSVTPTFLFSLVFNWSEFIREELSWSWERLRLLSSVITVQAANSHSWLKTNECRKYDL
ncbi:hypothetical protein NQZ68_001219 [Dissostichus eleginoides]|nr:hypothetical protein NQZ68_001219 [Dissostichus eleginoides]